MESEGYHTLDEIRGLALKNKQESAQMSKVVPKIDLEKCKGCGLCVKSCAYQAITLNKYALIDTKACFGCGLCVTRCPFNAIDQNGNNKVHTQINAYAPS